MKRQENIEGKILDALHNRLMSNSGSPEMTFTELSQGIDFPLDNKSRGGFFSCLFSLKERKMITFQSLEDNSGGLVCLTEVGMRVAEDRKSRLFFNNAEYTVISHMNTDIEKLSDNNIDYLINVDKSLYLLSQRNELLYKIKDNLLSKRHNFFILHGQPMVGKTRMLDYLSNRILMDEYIPLVVTMQGMNSVGDLDAFTFDLSDQLTSKFNKWVESTKTGNRVDMPKRKDFGKNKGVRAFYAHWNNIRQIISKTTVIMLDEIERLLDFNEKIVSRTINFLYDFVLNNENGYFISAGSEDVLFSTNKLFSSLIAKGEPIPIYYYDNTAVSSIFSSTKEYIIYEEEVLDILMSLSDGHPRVLHIMLEIIFSYVVERKERQNVEEYYKDFTIKKDDIDVITKRIVEKIKSNLWMLLCRLSQAELFALNIISKNTLNIVIGQQYSLDELTRLANVQSSKFYADLETGIDRLAQREWIEWNENKSAFRFKLGILLYCIRYHYIDIARLIRRGR